MKKKFFLIINIVVPLLIGAVIYYLISPDVIFVKRINEVFGKAIPINCNSSDSLLLQIVRNYMLDMMWGYALVFALYFILGNNTAELLKIFIIAFVFSAVIEIFQLTPIVDGTFDVFDLIAEFLAEAAAVFIIKLCFFRGGTKEV